MGGGGGGERLKEGLGSDILALQSRDKAAMLVVNTKEICWKNLHQNRVHFPAGRNAFVFDPQHGRRDVACKPAITVSNRSYKLTAITASFIVLNELSLLH